MSTRFKGRQTGFNKTGSNDAIPNPSGPPKTKFYGRGALPGTLKHYPGGASEIDGGNRRLAKSGVGDGGGHSTHFCTTGGNAFGRGRK